MEHQRLSALVMLLLIIALPMAAEVPDRSWGTARVGQDAPMWVAEELAVVDGQLQRQYFHPDLLPVLEAQLQVARAENLAGCQAYTEPARGPGSQGAFKGSSPAAIRASSAQVVTGQITDLEQGFLYARPGTLLEITTESRPPELTADKLYVFLRLADIDLEGTHLCTGMVEGRSRPEVGASVVLALEEPLEAGRILGTTPAGEPIVQPRSNELLIAGALPKAYEDDPVDVDRLRRELRGDGGPR